MEQDVSKGVGKAYARLKERNNFLRLKQTQEHQRGNHHSSAILPKEVIVHNQHMVTSGPTKYVATCGTA
jgi:hypothetical protein